jgi:hypothetical protein
VVSTYTAWFIQSFRIVLRRSSFDEDGVSAILKIDGLLIRKMPMRRGKKEAVFRSMHGMKGSRCYDMPFTFAARVCLQSFDFPVVAELIASSQATTDDIESSSVKDIGALGQIDVTLRRGTHTEWSRGFGNPPVRVHQNGWVPEGQVKCVSNCLRYIPSCFADATNPD